MLSKTPNRERGHFPPYTGSQRAAGFSIPARSQFGYHDDYDPGSFKNTETGQAFCDPRQWQSAEIQAHVLLAVDCWHIVVDRDLFGRDLSRLS